MGDSKKDYKASLIIGAAAAALSVIMVKNFGVTNPATYVLVAVMLLILPPVGIFVARLVGKKIVALYQFIKFAETGGLNTFVDLGVLNLLILITGLSAGIYYSLFKGISFVSAVINSYFWNKHWVFESKEKGEAGEKEFAKFIMVSIGGFIVNVSAASLIIYLAKGSSMESKTLANVAALIAFVLTMAWNFLGYKLVVFVKPKKK
ncbi:MAG: GtrA family protein [Patescibacteria group bacterium]